MSGGGQERGLRSGTLPHPIVAGFGAACEIAGREMVRASGQWHQRPVVTPPTLFVVATSIAWRPASSARRSLWAPHDADRPAHPLAPQERDIAHVTRLGDRLRQGIMNRIDHCVVNGSTDSRYPGNINISFAFVEGESLLMALKVPGLERPGACCSLPALSNADGPACVRVW